METLNIKKMSRLYHLKPSQRELEHRLDAALNCAMEEELDAALAQLGITQDEEVCVRLVHIPLSFNLGSSQQQTSSHWSEIIAAYIRDAIAKTSSDVVRYPSRVSALLDFATEVSRGRLQRAWAWNQLGLSNLQSDSSLHEARDQLIGTLTREHNAVLPVLIRLAEIHTLLPLLNQLTQDDCAILFKAVLVSFNQHWEKIHQILNDGEVKSQDSVSSTNNNFLFSQLNHSKLYTHVVRASETSSIDLEKPHPEQWACLILLELEPAFLSRPAETIRSLIVTLAHNIRTLSQPSIKNTIDQNRDISKCSDTQSNDAIANEKDKSAKSHSIAFNQIHSIDSIAKADGGEALQIDAAMIDTDRKNKNKTQNIINQQHESGETDDQLIGVKRCNFGQDGNDARPDNPANSSATATSILTHDEQSVDIAEPTTSIEVSSEFSGLLMLVHLMLRPFDSASADTNTANFVDAMLAKTEFSSRSLSWLLYQLVMRLLPIADDDPALRVFCGEDIDEGLLWQSEALASAKENILLDDFSKNLLQQLSDSFTWLELSTQDLLIKVCRRQGRIKVDRGWVDCIFSVDNTDTDIRRAGLDLDPDYVPWLGKVVKVRYE